MSNFNSDLTLSGPDAQVFKNDETGKVIVSHDGNPGIHSMFSDLHYEAGNTKHKRFDNVQKVHNQAEAKYGKDNITTVDRSKSEYRGELGNLVKASYQSQKDAAKSLGDRYTPDAQLSSMNTKVYLDKETNKPIILHRGTSNFKDILDDGLLAFGLGKYTSRYKNAQRVTKKVEAKYGAPAVAVGHSLGGWLAENSKNKGDILTYNKASGLGDIGTKKNSKRQFDVNTSGDVVSGIAHFTQNANKETLQNKNLFKNALTAHGSGNLFK